MNRPSVTKHGRQAIILITAMAMASLAFASPASASPPTPPFNQCPGVGFDASCAVLIVVNAHGGLESYVDPSQGTLDGRDAELIGVQNNSGSKVTSVVLKGPTEPFGFDEDGLCSGVNESGGPGFRAPPGGCPFGSTGYEGPNTSFSNYNEVDPKLANEGKVNFLNGTVEPGQSAYFSLETRPEVSCGETACEPVALATELSGGAQSGPTITVPDETAVTDQATLSGENAAIATGEVSYKVYSDSECKNLATPEAGKVKVSAGTVPASNSETLAPGTYYWQASYSGDSHNGGSQGACGSEVETVESAVTCDEVIGSGHVGRGSERQTTDNNLNTHFTGKEVFGFVWNGGVDKLHLTHLNTASCVVRNGEKVFSGRGKAAKLFPRPRVKNYEISFSIIIAPNGHAYLTCVIEKGHVVIQEFVNERLTRDKEHIF